MALWIVIMFFFNNMTRFKACMPVLFVCVLFAVSAAADDSQRVLVRDITTITGVRDNPLVGYGIVVGLHGTGDGTQTMFTTQTLANAMRRMGVQVSPTNIRVNNVAAVFVTASLPAFVRPGMKIDVTVSSAGDAKSLEGGVLLLTSLQGPDGQVYAEAQGPLVIGGYSAGTNTNSKVVNHATVGTITEGATVERAVAVDLASMNTISFMLRDPDFTAAHDIADAINHDFNQKIATALDSRRIDVSVVPSGLSSVPGLISRVQNLAIAFHPPAKVIVNERTGTIVMGSDVKLSPVSVLHGNLSIEVTTKFDVSQPAPLSNGETTIVPQSSVRAQDSSIKTIRLANGASVDDLIKGLQAIGASARDVVAILQAIKAGGGLQAELEVL